MSVCIAAGLIISLIVVSSALNGWQPARIFMNNFNEGWLEVFLFPAATIAGLVCNFVIFKNLFGRKVQ
jgi:hypothetical protein